MSASDGKAPEWHELWREQCSAAEDIEERFGRKRAMDYIIGEKLLNHLKASEAYRELAAETPKFVAAIKTMYEPWEISKYLNGAGSGHVETADDYKLDEIDRELVVEEAERIVLLEQARRLLVG